MNKKINVIGIIFLFLVEFIIHSMFKWFPIYLIAPFVNVNESIFEHIKMIYTSYVIWIIVKHYINKKNNITVNNYIFKELITSFILIILFLIIFLPLYYNHIENIFLTLSIYFFAIVLSQIINYYIKFKKNYKILNYLSFIVIIILYIISAYLTFKPPINNFFLDTTNNSYGLNK